MLRHSLILATVLLATGCGGADVKRVVGTVILDGAPLDGVAVCLWPVEGNVGVVCSPKTDDEGVFEIIPNAERGQGSVGAYRVLIREPLVRDETPGHNMFGFALPRVPVKYAEKNQTPLLAELEAGENELSPFCLQTDPEEKRLLKALLPTLPQGTR